MPKSNHRIRVSAADERREPEQIRRLGRAILALARAQLEAEAQATHADKSKNKRPGSKPKRAV